MTAQRHVTIEYSQFVLADFTWDDVEAPPLNEDESIGVGARSFRVMSLIHDHDVVLDVEVWDNEPPTSQVPLVQEVTITLTTGIVMVVELMGGWTQEPPIPCGMPGRYGFRVRRSLGFAVEDRGVVTNSDTRDVLERYLIQAWRLPGQAEETPSHGQAPISM
ncbi:hypothetical protein G3I60_39725 [Streptomyces sp. SID13666]|uniref:hypothetical protein n=1 Tax=unclassified Streptomyces TaxID=2593676 RepID=UPI0013C01752|nr:MULTISPECIES: hypothetical protein [unclassified Streptomyces]MCZ4098940.1 hypothetical protein [Streptomyces sp. H39-C1]NEA60131.1 hypothetical protein [Streptomyces sp. SID13666]